jgi:hypothetical protein
MKLTHEDFQKAKRISREIQSYLESANNDGLRSTEVYPVLARKNLIEKDKDNGVHFRKFLRHLMNMGVLESLMPQCKPQKSQTNEIFMEWYFYWVYPKETISVIDNNGPREIKTPLLTDNEIDGLVEQAKSHIEFF